MGKRRGRYSLTYGRNRQTATAEAGKRRMNGQAPYWLKDAEYGPTRPAGEPSALLTGKTMPQTEDAPWRPYRATDGEVQEADVEN